MKKLVLFAVLFVAGVSAFAFDFDFYKAAESETVYKDLDKMLQKDFSSKELVYSNFDGLTAMVNAVSIEERDNLFKKHEKAKAMYMGLNFLVPSLGSFMQGDVNGAVKTLVGVGVGAGLIAGGVIGMEVTLAAAYIALGSNYVTSLTDNYNMGSGVLSGAITGYGVALGFIIAGAVVETVSAIYSIVRPGIYANAFNAELANVLGVSDANLGFAPHVTTEGKADGVSVALSLKL